MQRLVGIARLAAEGELLETKRAVEYFELPTRKLLNRTSERMPFRWTLNPYRGCEFGCKYCYARYTHEFMELRRVRDFEQKIYAKRFVAAALRAELQKTSRKEAIAVGTATDPYQPAERRFGVTRAILGVFARESGWRLSVTTKSDLVTRDLDLMQAIARANVFHVNVTITTTDEQLARLLEPRAPRPSLRLEAVRMLAKAGIEVGVFANPVMPLLTDSGQSLDALAGAAKSAGAKFLGGGALFLKPCSRQVFLPFLERHYPELVSEYQRLFGDTAFLRGAYAEGLKERVRRVRARHGLADSPIEYTPELWHPEPEQGSLFECAG
ncbi:MAG TPA: radical SAM protein [Bryobacteraceae bacterium]